MSISIRTSEPSDKDSIRRVHEAAFRRIDEANLVERLMDSEAFIPALSLVATIDGKLIGHILYTRVDIIGSHGKILSERDENAIDSQACYAIALAPLAVLPEFQRQGVGKELINSSLDRAEESGHGIVIVLGHPEYYPKFGFQPASRYGMQSPFDVADDVFMVKPLQKHIESIRGNVVYHEAFSAV